MTATSRIDKRIIRDAYIEDGYCHQQEWIGDVVPVALAREIERENVELIGKIDYEAIAWALKKIKAFGCHKTEEGAMMTDRLEAILK